MFNLSRLLPRAEEIVREELEETCDNLRATMEKEVSERACA